MLTIQTKTGKPFDLIPGTKLSIEENSPLFSDAGSFSLPLELPPTDNNLQLLEQPHRIDRKKNFVTGLEVVISCGVWIRHARMDIESIGKSKNITTSFFFAESAFYLNVKEKMLADIFAGEKLDLFPNEHNLVYKLQRWCSHFNQVMCGRTITDYFIFPVCATMEDKEVITQGQNSVGHSIPIQVKTTWKSFTILNRPDVPYADYPGGTLQPDQYSENWFYPLHHNPTTLNEDGKTIKLPMGYGWAPFLKLKFVLNKLFAFAGYQYIPGYFADSKFSTLCILHNVADAMVRGYLEYSQIVPDVKITEFIEAIEDTFGCKFVIDEVHKTVTPLFWKNILTSSAAGNIDDKIIDYPTTEISEPSFFRLTMNRSISNSGVLEFESYQKMIQKYGQFQGSFKNITLLNNAITAGTAPLGVYFIQDARMYYAVVEETVPVSKIGVPNLFEPVDPYDPEHPYNPETYETVIRARPIEKYTIDWYDEALDNIDEKKVGTASLVLEPCALAGFTQPRIDVEATSTLINFQSVVILALQNYYSQFTYNDGVFSRLLFLNSIQHLNSVMQTTTVSGGQTTVTVEEEKKTKIPIMLANNHFFAKPEPGFGNIEKTFFASQDYYDNVGNYQNRANLYAPGLYEDFWKEYDDARRTSFHTISAEGVFKLHEFMQIDFSRTYLYEGQKVLIESIQYEISDSGVDIAEIKLKTVKKYDENLSFNEEH